MVTVDHVERYLSRSRAVDWDPDRWGVLEADPYAARAAWLLA